MGVFSCLLNVCVTVQKRLSTPSSCHPFLVRWEIYHLQKRRSIDLRDIIKRANLMGDEWCTAMAEEPPKIKAEFQAGVQLSFSQTSTMYLVHMLLTIVWCKIIWQHIWIKAYLILFPLFLFKHHHKIEFVQWGKYLFSDQTIA